MKTNLREQLTRYRCFIRPKIHCSPEFSFNFILKVSTTQSCCRWNDW